MKFKRSELFSVHGRLGVTYDALLNGQGFYGFYWQLIKHS